MMQKSKTVFTSLSAISIASLVGSFGFPLQRLEIYKQPELSTFKVPVVRTFILTENDRDFPYGFDESRAKKFAQIHEPYTVQKILLLTTAIGCSVAALIIGKELVPAVEYEEEISKLTLEGKKELSFRAIKQKFALANKSQQLLFLDEMAAMIQEFGSMESEMLEVDELNALYEQTEENLLPKDEVEETKPEVVDYRSQFPETMDSVSWGAIQKAIASGATREEIVKDVLGGGSQASAYFDFLKSKFL